MAVWRNILRDAIDGWRALLDALKAMGGMLQQMAAVMILGKVDEQIVLANLLNRLAVLGIKPDVLKDPELLATARQVIELTRGTPYSVEEAIDIVVRLLSAQQNPQARH